MGTVAWGGGLLNADLTISHVWFPWEGGGQGASCAGGNESQSTTDGDPGCWESGDTGLNWKLALETPPLPTVPALSDYPFYIPLS